MNKEAIGYHEYMQRSMTAESKQKIKKLLHKMSEKKEFRDIKLSK